MERERRDIIADAKRCGASQVHDGNGTPIDSMQRQALTRAARNVSLRKVNHPASRATGPYRRFLNTDQSHAFFTARMACAVSHTPHVRPTIEIPDAECAVIGAADGN